MRGNGAFLQHSNVLKDWGRMLVSDEKVKLLEQEIRRRNLDTRNFHSVF